MKSNNLRDRSSFFLLISLLSISLCDVASAASADFEKNFNKSNILFKNNHLSIYRSQYQTEKRFCDLDPEKFYHQLDVFYDVPHLQRLKRMGSSYSAFVKEIIIPVIVKKCGNRVNAKNMNIMINLHKIDQVYTPQDTMTFISREKGITYANYTPHEGKNNLTQQQIEALEPAYFKKQREKSYADTIAAMKKSDDRKKYGWRCRYGCVTLCNESATIYTIATSHLRWRDEGAGREVEVEGWFKLKPNQCYPPQTKIYWWTYYSVAVISKNGKWSFPQWPVKKELMDGKKNQGLSGVRKRSMCVKKTDKFMRRVPGKFDAIFNKSCPKGYVKVPVNLFTQGREGINQVNLLGTGGDSSENRVRRILLPQRP